MDEIVNKLVFLHINMEKYIPNALDTFLLQFQICKTNFSGSLFVIYILQKYPIYLQIHAFIFTSAQYRIIWIERDVRGTILFFIIFAFNHIQYIFFKNIIFFVI